MRTFNLDSREVDSVIIQLVKIKERHMRIRASVAEGETKVTDRYEFNEDFEQEQDAYKKQLKSMLQGEARQQ